MALFTTLSRCVSRRLPGVSLQLVFNHTSLSAEMSFSTRILRSPLLCPSSRSATLSTSARYSAQGNDSGWTGRQPSEHVTNRDDELNIQSGASQSGKRERASGDEKQSQATTEKDKGNQNEQAQKDHPEAPGPVIGMNDERGQVSDFDLLPICGELADGGVDGPQIMMLQMLERLLHSIDWRVDMDSGLHGFQTLIRSYQSLANQRPFLYLESSWCI